MTDDPLSSHHDFHPADFGIGVLFDSIRDGVIVGDAATESIVLWNAAAESIFGYSATEALGMPLHALIPKEFHAQHRRGLVHYYEAGQGLLIDSNAVLELPGLRKDGARIFVELTLTPVRHAAEASRYVVALLRDITARKEMEAQLDRYHAHLEQGLHRQRAASQRLAELDQLRNDFVAMVIHDLRNPLAAIRGITKTLQARWAELTPQDRQGLLDSMTTSTMNLTELMDEVFLVARLESGEFNYDIRPFDLAGLLRRTIEEQSSAHEGAPLSLELPERPPQALGDERRQGQILNNLLSNAIRFSPPKSPVEVSARLADHAFHISVSDRGPGIPADALHKLFKKFSRLDQPPGEERGGTGLGLYICKQMIKAQGGTIAVDSAPGEGSTFTYTVPVAE